MRINDSCLLNKSNPNWDMCVNKNIVRKSFFEISENETESKFELSEKNIIKKGA